MDFGTWLSERLAEGGCGHASSSVRLSGRGDRHVVRGWRERSTGRAAGRRTSEQSIELSNIKALRERAEPSLAIDGTNLTVPATAVTVEFTFAGTKQTETFHEVDVEGRWRWVLSDPEPYTKGECP